jgi:hypothetical protein
VLAVLFLAACGNAGGTVVQSQSSAPRQAASCKLPIGIGGAPEPRLSGFVAYPSGSFTQDPASDPTRTPYRGPNNSVIGPLGVPSYDWAAGRWLPVPRALVAPDGATYAYSELVGSSALPAPASGPRMFVPIGTRIHVVDVASAADHVILDSNTWWATVAYTGSQVYLIHAGPEESPDGGLFSVDVSTSAIRELVAPLPAGSADSPVAWTVIGADGAWGTDEDGRLFQFNFTTEAVSLWLTLSNSNLTLIGLNLQGSPIVSGDPSGAWLVTAPQQRVQIADGSVSVDDAIADSHGIWVLSYEDVVYLWTSGAGATLTVFSGGLTANGSTGRFGGPCQ